MPETINASDRVSLRGFGLALLLLNSGLVIAASVYAVRHDIPASVAIPIAAAFLLEASVYLVAGFPNARARLEQRFSSAQIALMAWAVSVASYLVYAVPTGVFSFPSAAKLAILYGLIAGLFLLAPPRGEGLGWADAVVLAALAYPMVSGVSTVFREIYISPHPEIPRLDALGKIMLVPLGAIVFLSIRKVAGTGFRFALSADDLKTGVKNYLLFLPVGIPLALATGFVRWNPTAIDHWTYVPMVVGNMLGIYLVIGLGEELYFRGLIQNLVARRGISPWAAQLFTSVLFGAAHLGRRGFPNWEFAAVAAVAGWFYGRAYVAHNSVPAAALTHTLVALTVEVPIRVVVPCSGESRGLLRTLSQVLHSGGPTETPNSPPRRPRCPPWGWNQQGRVRFPTPKRITGHSGWSQRKSGNTPCEIGAFSDGLPGGGIIQSCSDSTMHTTEVASLALRLSPGKNEYTVDEAARVLEVSADELRALLAHHVLDEMESIPTIAKMRFRPADLVMLNLVKHTKS